MQLNFKYVNIITACSILDFNAQIQLTFSRLSTYGASTFRAVLLPVTMIMLINRVCSVLFIVFIASII